MNINTDTLKTDINLQTAVHAFNATSFSPEKRGASVVASYVEIMTDLATFIESHAKDERQQDIKQEVFDGLKNKYKDKLLAHISAQGRCMSSMITGPSNFPVRKAEKANESEHKRSVELSEFGMNLNKYAIKSLAMAIPKPEQALTELDEQRNKLEKLKATQIHMKEINAQFRKGGWDNVTSISDDTRERAKAAMQSDWRTNPKPFETFQLTNNNANIKRVAARVKILETKAQATEEHGTIDKEYNELVVRRNFEEDRLQLLFTEKPNEDTRGVLKSHGFRWSPRFTAWQRKLTNNAIYVLNNIMLKDDNMKQYL